MLAQAAAAHANMTAKMVMDRVSHKTKIDVFENAFRKIKEVRFNLTTEEAEAINFSQRVNWEKRVRRQNALFPHFFVLLFFPHFIEVQVSWESE